jgi:hypothetical protein
MVKHSQQGTVCLLQGRAGVLKRTTNEQRLMGPSGGWIKIGVGTLLIQHETFQSLINLFPKNCWRGGGGINKILGIPIVIS